jgi:hypothetical protein
VRKAFGWLLGLLALVLIGALARVLVDATQPRVPATAALTAEEQRWAHDWLRSNDPRRHREDVPIRLTLSQRALNLLANYLVGRLGPGRARVHLHADDFGLLRGSG